MPEAPEGSVIISPDAVYKELREMHDEVRELKSLIVPALTDIRADVAQHGSEISELRAHGAAVDEQVTTIRTTMRVLYGVLILTITVVGVWAAIMQAVHGGN